MYKYFLALVFLSASVKSEVVEVDYTLKMTIHPQQGILSIVNGDSILECSAGGIISLGCGFNSVWNPGTNICEVPASQSFGIDYTVDNVDECWGTNGTGEWQGSLPPFSGGSGSFTKTISSGITGLTNFTLNCMPSGAFNYKAKIAEYSYSQFKIEGKYRGKLVWIGDKMHVIKRTEENIKGLLTVEGIPHSKQFKPYLVITDEKPVEKNGFLVSYNEMYDDGRCSILAGDDNIPHVNLSYSPLFANTCPLVPDKQYYVLRVLFKNGVKSKYSRNKSKRN